jgi:hypothetical protein
MSNTELEAYARDGKLPDWFTATVGAVPGTDVDDGGVTATASDSREITNGD